jgi:hypothetical protein
MLLREKAAVAGAAFAAGALAVFLGGFARPAGVLATPGGERPGEEIAALKKRVGRLEAEVADLRQVLRRAGGGRPDPSDDLKVIREIARLRATDLLQRARNAHDLVRDIRNGKVAGQALQAKVTDLNNDLGGVWLTLAGYGLGSEPYLDNIRFSDSGFNRAKPPPDHGLPGPFVAMGLPRLHERFLEASGVRGPAAAKKIATFKNLVRAYTNPAVFPLRDIGERSYHGYRKGQWLFTPQYGADMLAVEQWLTELESVLEKVPSYFEKAP